MTDAIKSLGNTGAMIAFYPSVDVVTTLWQQAVEGSIAEGSRAQAPDDMHVTLAYLGEAADIADKEEALGAALADYAASREPVGAMLNGLARFYTLEDSDTHPLVVTVDAPQLPDLRQDMVALARSAGVEPVLNHGFVPHVTIAYLPCGSPTPAVSFQPLPDNFLKLSLVIGDRRTDYPFQVTQQGKAAHITKQANGLYRWYSISSNNIKDRDGETIRLRALQTDVARTKMFGDDSHLRLYHIPYDIGGAPDYRAIVDGMLVESGEFYEDPVAVAVAEYCIDHPDGIDGSGWGTSIGYYGLPDKEASYGTSLIEERSLLPLSKAANAHTRFGVKEKMALTADQQKALDTVLGDPALVGVVRTALGAQDQSKMADATGAQRKMASQPEVPVFKAAGQYAATPQTQLGFGAAGAGQRKMEGDDVAAAAAAEANLGVAAQAVGAAMDAVGALGASEVAEPAPAPDTAPAGEPPEAKAADATDQPAPDATPKPGISDDDATAIAKYVNETVQKAVSAAMEQMKAEFNAVRGDMQKMEKTFSVDTQVKMLNEVPRSTFERLKAFGTTPAAAVPPTVPGFANGIPAQVANPAYVEKGHNLPAAPEGVDALMAALGFGQSSQ